MVKYQNLTCNLAGTRLKADPVFGRVPLGHNPIVCGPSNRRSTRLGPSAFRETGLGQWSGHRVPGTMHSGAGATIKAVWDQESYGICRLEVFWRLLMIHTRSFPD